VLLMQRPRLGHRSLLGRCPVARTLARHDGHPAATALRGHGH
jgi:hypothetical protein